MAPVIEELHARGLLFLDSRTTATTVGEALARKRGVPAVARDVFLDDEVAAPAIAARLADLEQAARRKGAAVAIGHAHDATLAALVAWLPALAAKQLVLVPLSTVVRHNEPGADVTLLRRDSPERPRRRRWTQLCCRPDDMANMAEPGIFDAALR